MAQQLKDIFTGIEESHAAGNVGNPVWWRNRSNPNVGRLGAEGCEANERSLTRTGCGKVEVERGRDGAEEEIEIRVS